MTTKTPTKVTLCPRKKEEEDGNPKSKKAITRKQRRTKLKRMITMSLMKMTNK
jgi:hypothetical protein